MKLVIFGSRGYPFEEQVREYVRTLDPDVEVIVGDADGVDFWAADECAIARRPHRIFKARWDVYGKQAGIVRNDIMANEADAGTGFWDGSSNGTRDMRDRLRARGKPVDMRLPQESLL
jgi:hypothetical protein